MKQMIDTISTFPLDCAGDNVGRADRRRGDTPRVRSPRFILCPAGNSSAGRGAATARTLAPTEAYAESSMAYCASPPGRQSGTSLPRADSLAKRRHSMAHRLFGRIPMPHSRWLDGRSIALSRGVLRCLEQAGRK